MIESFDGIKNLYGKESFAKLQKSHVIVVGIGGVGSWACESLIRSGLGKLTMIDMDDICVSNINRQVHATTKTLGKEKVYQMKERLLEINPIAEINAIFDFFTPDTMDTILSTNADFILDAMDSVNNKCLLAHECKEREINFLTTGAAGQRVDPTMIHICDLNRTINDKLCKRMKRILKKDYGYFRLHKSPYKIPCVSSKEIVTNEVLEEEFSPVRNCQTILGSASFVTGTMGFVATSYILGELTK